MTLLRPINPGLRDIFRLGVRQVYASRMWMYLGLLQVFLQLVLVRAVWHAVYEIDVWSMGFRSRPRSPI